MYLFGVHRLLEEAGLLDDVARWLLLLLDHAFVDKTLQPRLGLGGGHVQRSGNLGVSWSRQYLTSNNLRLVYGTSPSDIYVFTENYSYYRNP